MRYVAMVVVVLGVCAASLGTVDWDPVSGILAYTSPSDLGTGANIDPPGLNDVTNEYVTVDDLSFDMTAAAPVLIGDINGDGYVNVGDLQALVAAWGSQETPPSGNWNANADINDDGYVNVGDLQLLVAHWDQTINNKPILGQSDFVYQGHYIVRYGGDLAELCWGQGFTHRYVGGQLRFLTYSFFGNVPGGGYHLIEFAPPAGGLGGTVTTRTNHWPDIFGPTGMAFGNGVWGGLWYEQSQERLWTTWAVDYPDNTMLDWTKSFVIRTLNSDGTVSNVQGPWGLQGIGQRRVYGGVTAIPSWFQSTYGVPAYGAGWGGYTSRMAQGLSAALAPTFYAFPEPTGYPAGDIPTSAFKILMDPGNIYGADWYPYGHPTNGDRGVRNSDVQNDYDKPYWQSPAPDGLGRWTWGDSNWNTGCWIETPTRQGFITVPQFCNGRTWYEGSTLHAERQSAEIQVFDPHVLGEVAQGSRASWNTYPASRWEITGTLAPLGFNQSEGGNSPRYGPAGASYDPTTQTLYIYCIWGNNYNSYILVYHVN